MVTHKTTHTSRTITFGTIESKAIQSSTTKLIVLLMLALTGLLNMQSVSADPRYYNIEVIIFDDADERYLRSEHWPQKPETIPAPLQRGDTTYPIIASLSGTATGTEVDGDMASENSTIFQNIEPSILTNEAKRISNSRHYQMLFYGAWTQEGLDSEHAININLEQLNNQADVRTKNTIIGKLKVVLARYLHFYSELEYIPEHKVKSVEKVVRNSGADGKQNDNDDIIKADHKEYNSRDASNLSLSEEQVLVDYYPVSNHRRMRSKVLHYIDHPLVGILVQINPVQKTGD